MGDVPTADVARRARRRQLAFELAPDGALAVPLAL